jgi:hypothetical protein
MSSLSAGLIDGLNPQQQGGCAACWLTTISCRRAGSGKTKC